MGSVVIAAVTCALMIASILFFPEIPIRRRKIAAYPFIVLLGAIVMIAAGQTTFSALGTAFTDASAVNPIKILVLFLSMTLISVFLDEVGFFRYLASKALRVAGGDQRKMFAVLYWTVSLLTVFTSNDIIVLTFTPFLCYFAKNAGIDPKPYLVAEFIAANTMSMTLVIGNPTNIYIASAYQIGFGEYFLLMALPTLASALLSFGILWLIFFKKLRTPVSASPEEVALEDKPLLAIGVAALVICTIFLIVGPYIGIEMWLISLSALALLLLAVTIVGIKRKRYPKEVLATLKRAPWQLVPFVLSMFVIILGLAEQGVTEKIGAALGSEAALWKYGALSYLAANLINNIPMSVLFCPIVGTLPEGALLKGVYATIVGSNLGAFLTPIGALAGIMWMSLLKRYDVKMRYRDFILYGAAVSIPSLAVNLAVLSLLF